MLSEFASGYLQLTDHAGSFKHLYVNGLLMSSIISRVLTSYFSTANSDNADVIFRARDHGVGLVECARLESEAEPSFGISRAGTIVLLPTKGLFCANGVFAYPLTAPTVDLVGESYYIAGLDRIMIYDGAAWQIH